MVAPLTDILSDLYSDIASGILSAVWGPVRKVALLPRLAGENIDQWNLAMDDFPFLDPSSLLHFEQIFSSHQNVFKVYRVWCKTGRPVTVGSVGQAFLGLPTYMTWRTTSSSVTRPTA